MTAKQMQTLVPDTSVIVEGLVSKYIKQDKIKPKRIVIPEAVVNELEHQANQGRETGYIGIDELKDLQTLSKKASYEVVYAGERPGEFEINFAKSGAVDNLIREVARKEDATLMTADRVQAIVAQAQGVTVEYIEFEWSEKDIKDPLGEHFSDTTMSVHFKEDTQTIAKRGKPGEWEFKTLKHKPNGKDMQRLSKDIVEAAQMRQDGFIEIERPGSTIVQLGRYRVVIAKPPFASSWEITAVRPVAHLSLDDYEYPEKFKKRLENKAEGILISGSPGEGKSTFTQALGEFYANQGRIVKTVEAPRDLVLPDTITQYSASHGSPEEIRDVLLLNRPDYTVYDEIRNTQDFLLFADMRLSGVGMIGVVHATSPVDSIQRFIGRVELGMVPQIIDTVVFIKAGAIDKVYSLEMRVKVPAGMTEADLARPVVVVKDFYADKAEFEIYTYGDQTTVVPVEEQEEGKKSAVLRFAEEGITDYFAQITPRAQVELLSENKARVYVPDNKISQIIGKGGSRIQEIEQELGIGIDVESLKDAPGKSAGKTSGSTSGGNVQWEAQVNAKSITISLPNSLANKDVDLLEGGDYIASMTASKQAQISISTRSDIGKKVKQAIKRDRLEVHA